MKRFRSWWQKSRLHSWWGKIRLGFGWLGQKIKRHPYVTGLLVFLVLLILFIFLAYRFGWGWAGFARKTIWDWLQPLGVLAVPIVVGFGAVWFAARYNHDIEIARAQHENERRITLDNQREAALQAYIDKISELLLKEHLDERTADGKLKPEYAQVRKIAHIRTLTVLSSLDHKRKGKVLQFIHEADLINKKSPIISLVGADLRGADLSEPFHVAFPWAVHSDIVDTVDWGEPEEFGADLREADLFGAILSGANLSRACLHNADLRAADLRDANLYDADLSGVWLRDANLRGADLSEAYLEEADLSGVWLRDTNLRGAWLRNANLYSADISKDQLDQVRLLQGATMPDGDIHD